MMGAVGKTRGKRGRADAVGAVLAGGAGERLGEPKPLADLGGRPLIEHAVSSVVAAGLEPLIVAKPSSSLPEISGTGILARIVREPESPRHPLLGIVTALREAGDRPAIVLACDLPFVPPRLLAWLAEQPEPLIVCEAGGRLHPLVGRYRPSLRGELAAALERGDSVQDAVLGLDPRIAGAAELSRFGAPERILFNVNTPQDLDRAARLLET